MSELSLMYIITCLLGFALVGVNVAMWVFDFLNKKGD